MKHVHTRDMTQIRTPNTEYNRHINTHNQVYECRVRHMSNTRHINCLKERDQKLEEVVGHGESETRTNVNIIMSLLFCFKSKQILLSQK